MDRNITVYKRDENCCEVYVDNKLFTTFERKYEAEAFKGTLENLDDELYNEIVLDFLYGRSQYEQ